MSDENVNTLAEKYQSLRNVPGKIGGGEYDERVDSTSGEKYQVMKVCVRVALIMQPTFADGIYKGSRRPSWFTWYTCC